MSLTFFTPKEEETTATESINNYRNLFESYTKQSPSLKEALEQMFFSAGASKDEVKELISEVIEPVDEFISRNFESIKEKYKNISKEEAMTISAYTYELCQSKYNVYRILNTNLVAKNRQQGIKNISKYLFLLLKALRKLTRYYPENYLYRCISVLVKLNYDSFNKSFVPYLKGNEKTFWGFTSTSPDVQTSYNFLDKGGTIFSLAGENWGYDIQMFNLFGEEEILLEPERKLIIEESLPEVNGIIFVRAIIKKTPLVLEDLFENKEINKLVKLVKVIKDIKISVDKGISDKIKRFNEKFQCSIENNQIEELDFYWKKLGNIDLLFEIEFPKLKKLHFDQVDLSSLNGFENAKFEKLEIFDICSLGSDKLISDINVLEKVNFKNLKLLRIIYNSISDISVLEKVNFRELNYLDFQSNNILNIDVLDKVKFEKLEVLCLNCNHFKNITVLAKVNFPNLKSLNLLQCGISDISPLEKSKFEKLETLNLRYNYISDIRVLGNCNFPCLTELYLDKNWISDITVLETVNFKGLKLLNLANNQIADIKVLENTKFEKLERLFLEGNKFDAKKFSSVIKKLKSEKVQISLEKVND